MSVGGGGRGGVVVAMRERILRPDQDGAQIVAAVPNRDDWGFAVRQLSQVPEHMRPAILRDYASAFEALGRRDANLGLLATGEAFPHGRLSLSASDEEIREYAKSRAAWVMGRLYTAAVATAGAVRDWLEKVLRRDHIDPPSDKVKLTGLIARVTSERWWRRKLRSITLRRMEGAAIVAGFVHCRAGVYASDEAVVRRGQQARRNAAAMQAAIAENEQGQQFSLAELSAVGVSNPAVRRAELMVRVRGVEEYARAKGYEALFLTWTAPSRYHARLNPSGAANQKAAGITPKETQGLLTRQWAKARAKLHRSGVDVMGLRVAEPHHDGTPHWHLLIFVRSAFVSLALGVMANYAAAEDWHELTGAAADYTRQVSPEQWRAIGPRFKVERIDYQRGTAAGYVAKYVAKNIDGEHIDIDYETGEPGKTSAERVTAWARTWGIRQFQFFGVPEVGPWRELRKVRDLDNAEQLDFFDAWNAADTGDWYGYMKASERGPVSVFGECEQSSYPGERVRVVMGVEREGRRMVTRTNAWEINWRGASLREGRARPAPWTRVNNCTRPAAPVAGVEGDGDEKKGIGLAGKGAARTEKAGGEDAADWGAPTVRSAGGADRGNGRAGRRHEGGG